MEAIGKKIWAIAEGYIPKESANTSHEMISHETACILNSSDQAAHLRILIYFRDREPAGPYYLAVQPRRTFHLRFNDLTDPERIPLGVDYSSLLISDVPIVVQHTRLDSRQPAHALLSTVAFAA